MMLIHDERADAARTDEIDFPAAALTALGVTFDRVIVPMELRRHWASGQDRWEEVNVHHYFMLRDRDVAYYTVPPLDILHINATPRKWDASFLRHVKDITDRYRMPVTEE